MYYMASHKGRTGPVRESTTEAAGAFFKTYPAVRQCTVRSGELRGEQFMTTAKSTATLFERKLFPYSSGEQA